MTVSERQAWKARTVWMYQNRPEWAEFAVINSLDWQPFLVPDLGFPFGAVRHTTRLVPLGEVWWGTYSIETGLHIEPYTPFANCVQLEIPEEV